MFEKNRDQILTFEALSAFAARQALQSRPISTRSPGKRNGVASHARSAALSGLFERASGFEVNVPQVQKDVHDFEPPNSTATRDDGDLEHYEDGQLRS